MEWSGVEWSGLSGLSGVGWIEWSRVEWIEWSGVEWIEWSGVEWIEWSGVEWIERGGVEWSGVESPPAGAGYILCERMLLCSAGAFHSLHTSAGEADCC